MIMMSQIYPDELRASLGNEAMKDEFKRIVLKTRFEIYSDYLWEKLNSIKHSFVFNLDENTWVNRRGMLHRKKDITDALSSIIDNMMKENTDFGFMDRKLGVFVPISDISVLDEIYCIYRYHYYTEVNHGFGRSFKPNNFDNAIIYTNGCSPESLIKKQDKALEMIEKSKQQLLDEENGLPEYFSPNKNRMIHSAMTLIRTVFEPNYNKEKINNVLKDLNHINKHRGGRILDNIGIEEMIFSNEVALSNKDYRIIYDILRLLGFIRMDEECNSRDSAKYMRSVDGQSKNVDMLVVYDMKIGMNSDINIRKIARMAQNFMKNDAFILTDRQDIDFAFMQ